MANSALTKITAQAKRIRKQAPGKKWLTAVKEASAMYRSGKLGRVKKPAKKVGATKFIEKGETKKTTPSRYYAVKRTKAGTYKNVTRLSGMTSKPSMKAYYRITLGKLLLKKELSTTARDRKKVAKEIVQCKKALKFFD